MKIEGDNINPLKAKSTKEIETYWRNERINTENFRFEWWENEEVNNNRNPVNSITNKSTSVSNLAFLRTLNRKYPNREARFLKNQALKNRLQNLLGKPQFDFLQQIWSLETPVKIENNLFYAWGGHSGYESDAAILYDFGKDLLSVGIRTEGKEKFYVENGVKPPKKLLEWADEFN